MLEGPCAESEEKHEPASDADAAVVDSLKALDLNRPIREADISRTSRHVRFVPEPDSCATATSHRCRTGFIVSPRDSGQLIFGL